MMGGLRDTRLGTARRDAAERRTVLSKIPAEVERLRADVARMRGAFQDGLAELAATDRKDRAAFMASLRAEVKETCRGFCAAFREKAEEARTDRVEFIEQLASHVRELRSEAAAMCAEFRGTLAEQAEQARGERAAFVEQLAGKVAETRNEVAADMAAVRKAWFGLVDAGPPSAREGKARRAEPGRAPEAKTGAKTGAKTEAKPEAKPEPEADDLTAIAGIGPKLQEALNEAGIRTYADIVNTPANALRRIVGGLLVGGQDVETWITKAAGLSKRR